MTRSAIIKNKQDLSELLLAARHGTRLTIRDIAKFAEFSYQSVNHWEGGVHSPTVRNLVKYAEAMGMELRIEFVEEGDE